MTLPRNHWPLDCIVEVRCAITLPFHPIDKSLVRPTHRCTPESLCLCMAHI